MSDKIITKRSYCVKCFMNYDEEYLVKIDGYPICFKCAPVMCGDCCVPINDCNHKVRG